MLQIKAKKTTTKKQIARKNHPQMTMIKGMSQAEMGEMPKLIIIFAHVT